MSERIIKVSPHLLADVSSCATKGWLRHVLSYTSRGEAIKAIAGQGFHKAVEELFDPRVADDPISRSTDPIYAFHDIYDAPYSRLAAEKLEPSYTPQNLDRVLRRWIEMHPASALPWKRVVMVEEAFVAAEWVQARGGQLGPYTPDYTRIQLIVRPDLVVEDFDGMIRWVDTKTTGWHIDDLSWQRSLRLSSQAQLYTAGIQARFGDRAILGGWFSAIELRKLPGKADDGVVKLKKDGTPAKVRLCLDHGLPYAQCGNEHAKAMFVECKTTPERITRALDDAKDSAIKFIALLDERNVNAIAMDGTQKDSCRFCFAADFCEASRPNGDGDADTMKAILESFFIYSPWLIEEGRRSETN